MTFRLIVSLFVATALLCELLSAQAPAPNATDTKGVLEGKVLSLSGEPLRKATLHLRAAGAPPPGSPTQSSNYAVTSDATGKFLFDDVDPGRYTLSADRTGYLQQSYGARGPNRTGLPLTIAAGAPLTGLVLTLTPQGIISGKVEDEDGDPLANVEVVVYRMGYQGGQKQFMRTGTTNSNADGSFMVGYLAPGRYYLSASDNRSMMMGTVAERSGTKAPQNGYLMTYYPNVLDPSSATPIDITTGADVHGIEIRLVKGRLYRIRGKLTGAEGFAGSMVLTPSFQGLAQPAPVQRDGWFTFQNVSPGEYTIRSNRGGPRNPGQAPQLFAYTRVTIRDQDMDGLEVPLGPGREIKGSVQMENDPLAAPANLRIVLQIATGSSDNTGLQNALSRPDGTFQMRGLAPEKYQIAVTGQAQGAYVKSIRFENVDITRDYLDLTSGSGGALEILLSPKAADVSGIVRNESGEPVPNVPVTLWTAGRPANGVFSPARGTNTDASGAFQIFNLGPGEYRVAAWEDLEPGLAQNPDFRARFESTAAKVEVQESTHATADTKLVGRDAIQAEITKLP